MESTIKIDMSGFNKLKKNLQKLTNTKLNVGVLDDPFEAEKAYKNHLGGESIYSYGKHEGESVVIPPRPFLTLAFEEFGQEIINKSVKEMDITSKDSISSTMKKIGKEAVLKVRYVMDNSTSLLPPRNSKRTIETKGFDHPLIATGNMRSSINYEVVE